MESESRIAKIYGLKCAGFNKNCKTWKKKSLIYTMGKKEVSRNCLWLPPDVGINRWIFLFIFLINRWIFQISYYKYVKIAKGNYV